MQRATYRSFLPFMHASYCRRCTGTMSGDDDLSTHYALAKLLSCPRRNSWRRRNSAPHLARFTATLAAHLARVTAILAALASPLTSILTPFHASGLRLRVRGPSARSGTRLLQSPSPKKKEASVERS
jgi:hypothetical protein